MSVYTISMSGPRFAGAASFKLLYIYIYRKL